ncbi:MAG: universal stress protein [Bacteroidales bacterium]|nr:universal stress protein [Bacteroidales bacterium]MDY6406144.1 universal stress protein [Bacteroidales bacterium]
MIWENNEDIKLIECANEKRTIQRNLNESREERRPYVFITSTMTVKPLRRLLVPVSMLEEETYKAEICTYIARKTGAHIILLQANDYGSHAQQNVNRIITHIEAVNKRLQESPITNDQSAISYEIVLARKDSFKLMQEASERQRDFQHDLLILTASRDYGLDDILFGPPERKAIQRALVPVMLVNPREDLFSLCD